MQNNPFDLVLFDLDGTLVETSPEITDAVNDTLKRFALPEVEQSLVSDWIGHGTKELLAQAVAHVSVQTLAIVKASDVFKLMLAEFDVHYKKRCGTRSHLYPRVLETLLYLRSVGIKTAVLTNKEAVYTDIVLKIHDLTNCFDLVISGDTLITKKPNPAGIELGLSTFNVLANRALMVGDSSIDIQTARNAGIAVWAVPYGYNMGQKIEDSNPDRLISTFADLMSLGI
jgi:phosphoglycolate phosphatase